MAWTNLYPIPEAQMKMRFKEPYVTEGLNAKTAVSLPRGIYRGFNLGTSPLDLTVVLKADEHSNDHVAVFESAAGLSLTVRVEGGDVSLDLSAFAEETVVLAIFCDYTRFETTEGAIRAYKLADFLAAPEKESLIVIGQVDVPELDPIPEADITYNRRIEAWQSKAPSAVNWAPLLTNGAFDRGPLGVIESPDIPGWYVTGHSGTTVVEPTLVSTHGAIGGRCFVFDVTSADAGDEVNLTFSTGCGVPVNPGSKIRFRCFKRVDKVPSSGSLSEVIPLSFRRADGSSIPGFPVALEIDFDAIDPDWVPVEVVTTIPDEAVELVGFSADWDNIFFDSTGPFINLDGFQIWVENREALEPYSFFDSGRRSLEGRNLYLTPNGNDFVRFAIVTRDGSYVAWSDVLAADKGIFGNVASDPSFPEGHAVRGYGTGTDYAGIYGEGTEGGPGVAGVGSGGSYSPSDAVRAGGRFFGGTDSPGVFGRGYGTRPGVDGRGDDAAGSGVSGTAFWGVRGHSSEDVTPGGAGVYGTADIGAGVLGVGHGGDPDSVGLKAGGRFFGGDDSPGVYGKSDIGAGIFGIAGGGVSYDEYPIYLRAGGRFFGGLNSPGVFAVGDNGVAGVHGRGYGSSNNSVGIHGLGGEFAAGVLGIAANDPTLEDSEHPKAGGRFFGASTDPGVYGRGDGSGPGVFGSSESGVGVSGKGVSHGVAGVSEGAPIPGFAMGVFGTSDTAAGVWGRSLGGASDDLEELTPGGKFIAGPDSPGVVGIGHGEGAGVRAKGGATGAGVIGIAGGGSEVGMYPASGGRFFGGDDGVGVYAEGYIGREGISARGGNAPAGSDDDGATGISAAGGDGDGTGNRGTGLRAGGGIGVFSYGDAIGVESIAPVTFFASACNIGLRVPGAVTLGVEATGGEAGVYGHTGSATDEGRAGVYGEALSNAGVVGRAMGGVAPDGDHLRAGGRFFGGPNSPGVYGIGEGAGAGAFFQGGSTGGGVIGVAGGGTDDGLYLRAGGRFFGAGGQPGVYAKWGLGTNTAILSEGDVLPGDSYTYDLGKGDKVWNNLYASVISDTSRFNWALASPSGTQSGRMVMSSTTRSPTWYDGSRWLKSKPVYEAFTTEASGTGTGVIRSVTIPANRLTAGSVIRIRAFGRFVNASAFSLAIRIGPDSANMEFVSGVAVTGHDGDPEEWTMQGDIVIRSIGTSGTMFANGWGATRTGNFREMIVHAAPPSINTQVVQTIDLRIASITGTGATVTNQVFIVEVS